jgi:nucleotide sugar dehydrogenase
MPISTISLKGYLWGNLVSIPDNSPRNNQMLKTKHYSRSPFGEDFEYRIDELGEKRKLDKFVDNNRQTVVVQGLGFVGTAMVAALSQAKNDVGRSVYNVIGTDLADDKNYWKIGRINEGKPPVVTTDEKIHTAIKEASENNVALATYSNYSYSLADVIIVDIQLDVRKLGRGEVRNYEFSYQDFRGALMVVAEYVKEDALIIIETTVPPGTTSKIVYPIFEKAFRENGKDLSKLSIVNSYERVMPGKKYYDSIVNYYRVYAGIDETSANRAEAFFKTFVNTDEYPLTRLHSTTASEISKVLENSYRAMNIAFIKEWAEFADLSEVNLFEVIDAIRVRKTHSNIMQPGFGVGGYCLTKDALLADWAYRNLFDSQAHLQMSTDAIATNDLMPELTFKLLKFYFEDLTGKYVTILGISYLNDVADTRNSPSEYFYDLCINEKCIVNVHDTLVSFWEEKAENINTQISAIREIKTQVAVFTVKHQQYMNLSSAEILALMPELELLVDANNVISDRTAKELAGNGIGVIGVGKGHWKAFNQNHLPGMGR